MLCLFAANVEGVRAGIVKPALAIAENATPIGAWRQTRSSTRAPAAPFLAAIPAKPCKVLLRSEALDAWTNAHIVGGRGGVAGVAHQAFEPGTGCLCGLDVRVSTRGLADLPSGAAASCKRPFTKGSGAGGEGGLRVKRAPTYGWRQIPCTTAKEPQTRRSRTRQAGARPPPWA